MNIKKTLTFLFLLVFTDSSYSMGGKVSGENIPSNLYWNLCESNISSLLKNIPLAKTKDFITTEHVFDTPNFDLKTNKYSLTLKHQNGKWDSYLKMNYNDPREIPDFIPSSMNCIKNYFRDEQFLSCTIRYKKADLQSPISDTQEDSIENKLRKDISTIKLIAGAPLKGRSIHFKYTSKKGRKYTLKLKETQAHANIIQISARVTREEEDILFKEISDFFSAQKIILCAHQKTP